MKLALVELRAPLEEAAREAAAARSRTCGAERVRSRRLPAPAP